MKLLFKVNLALVIVFGAGLFVTAQVADNILQSNAKQEVLSHARLMMETAMITRNYTISEVKPLLSKQLQSTFLPQSVPSYAATQSFNKLHDNFPDYSYKEATLNPTNLRDRATDWEADVVRNLNLHPDVKEFIGERNTETGRSLYLAKPILITNPQCLMCHSTPAAAPKTMIAMYGSANGFGWKMNEIIGAQIVSVPMSVPISHANHAFKLIMGGMLVTFVILLLVVNVIFHLMVLRPISKMATIASAISEGKMDAEKFKVTGNDEISVLSNAFNRMRISLEKAMALLE